MVAKPRSSVFIDTVVFEVENDTASSSLIAFLKDEFGIIMSSLSTELPEGITYYRWNGLNELPYGVYVLEVHHGEQQTRVKMIKRI